MLRWRGRKVTERVVAAQMRGINETMAAAVMRAKLEHEFVNRTGTLEQSVRVDKFATRRQDGVYGRWGSLDVVYALRIELGFQGRDRLGRVFNQRSRPFLVPAANREYPLLARRIRAAL